MLLKRRTGAGSGEREQARGTGNGERGIERKNRVEMKLLIGLGFKLGFIPIVFIFPSSHTSLPRFGRI